MIAHHARRRVRHAPDDVFALVGDVRDYPNFIRWIQAMRVREERVVEGSGELVAEAIVGYKFVRERFTTRVRLDKPGRAIDVALVSGPFTALENRWRFDALSDGSTAIDFDIGFEFRNPILQQLLSANFGRATNTLIEAFERRAAQRFAIVGDPRSTLADLEARG